MKTLKDKRTLCECGCGKSPKHGRFLPGHDAKHKKALFERADGGDTTSKAAIEGLGWMPAYRKHLHVLKNRAKLATN